jgi:metallophosphoesterase (TIGR03767 family)
MVQAGATSLGAMALWPTAVLLRRHDPAPHHFVDGTTLESTVTPGRAPGYRRLREGPPWPLVVREDLATGRRGREDRRQGLATLVQLSDLHVTDVQHPMRFEYIDRLNRTGHRPQELLTVHGAAALVARINGLRGGPATGRPVDAVVSTGDNTDNQAGTELEWLLTVLAGGVVTPDSGSVGHFEGVAGSGLAEYWQPDLVEPDRYKALGFPHVPGLVDAATSSFATPGLRVPWLLTTGNHDVVANGMLANRAYVEDWCCGDRKIFSARGDAAVRLAGRLAHVQAGDEIGGLLDTIARSGLTRRVQPDPRRRPYDGADYVRLLHQARFTGAGPVGHGYAPDATSDRLYYRHQVAPQVYVISLDSTNQAGGIDGSIGATQSSWLTGELERLRDCYVVVLTHHPSWAMDNLAPDPRTPTDTRTGSTELIALLHRFPQVVAWVNGHSHRNRIVAHAHPDPRRSFWEINSASHVDAPQQARVLELGTNGDGSLSLFTTMIDADAPAAASYDDLSPRGAAALYRELAYNDPAYQERRGARHDRNAELLLVDPLGS